MFVLVLEELDHQIKKGEEIGKRGATLKEMRRCYGLGSFIRHLSLFRSFLVAQPVSGHLFPAAGASDSKVVAIHGCRGSMRFISPLNSYFIQFSYRNLLISNQTPTNLQPSIPPYNLAPASRLSRITTPLESLLFAMSLKILLRILPDPDLGISSITSTSTIHL